MTENIKAVANHLQTTPKFLAMNTAENTKQTEEHDWIITHRRQHLDFINGLHYIVINHSWRAYKIYLAPNNVELPEFPGDNIFLRTEPSHVKNIYLTGQLLPNYAILLTGLIPRACKQYDHCCFQIKEPSWIEREQNNTQLKYSYILLQ
jgi:hypothetical protein